MPNLKVTLLGDASSGKTQLVNRYVKNTYEDTYRATIGATLREKKIDKNTQLDFWDCAGQERFASLVPMYARGADAIILNIALPEISEDYNQEKYMQEVKSQIKKWLDLCKNSSQGVPIILALNKSDLAKEPAIASKLLSEIKLLANENGIQTVFVTSAKANTGVIELFEKTAKLALQYAEQKGLLQENADKTIANKVLSKSRKNPSLFSKLNNPNTLAILLIMALVLATVLLILLPPAGLAAYVATGIAAAGLSGLSIGLVAAIAGTAVALLGLTLFGIFKATAAFFARDKHALLAMEDFTKPEDKQSLLPPQGKSPVLGGPVVTKMPGTAHALGRGQGSTGVDATPIQTSDKKLNP